MRSHRHAAALILGLAILLAACGAGSSDAGSDGGGDKPTTTAASAGGGSDSGDDSGSSSVGGGDVDCAAVTEAAQQLLSVQLLAQLDSPESIQPIKDKEIGALDLAKFQAAMETLHQLDGSSGPLGDPKEAIDTYQAAATKAQALFDADPPTQADIDAYNQSIGEPGEFLGHQAAISGALAEAGC
jgi:hypothetical protein